MTIWTSATPTKEGDYWYAGKYHHGVSLLYVHADNDGALAVLNDGGDIPLSDMQNGWWAVAEILHHPDYMDEE